MKKQKVVLAYSGGLDTSFCVKYLTKDKDLEVHTIFVKTGGFSDQEHAELETRAKELGAKSHRTIDVTNAYYQKCIRYLIYGNVLKNHTYPLSVSAERVFQAMAVANFATKFKADFIAHGSTGAGNDQVRFDLIFGIMAPDISILTPIRDNQFTREQEINYLKETGWDEDWEKAKYSINKGLWGISVGGEETKSSDKPLPDEAYPTTVDKKDSIKIELLFSKGQFIGIDTRKFTNPVEAISELNALAAAYGIGRDIHVGDTIVGIKGRVGFEAAAPILIIKAHEALEKHVLTKWQIHWKEQLANWYGMLLHEGQYLDPVMRNIESFLQDTQGVVNGSVYIKLAPHRFEIEGIESPNDLMSTQFGEYGETFTGWTGEDVRGFSKILANQSRIYRAVNNGKDKK